MKKERIDSINIIRAIAAVAVFMYHAYWNIGCRYGILDVWIEQSFVWMTLFFMLSGVVLRYNYGEARIDDADSLWKYFGKRALAIFPLYFLIELVYMFYDSGRSLMQDFAALPFQMTLTQEFAHYPYLMNGGTWFFSCIFICYLLFPYLNTIASAMTKGYAVKSCVVLTLLFGFTPLVANTFAVDIYNNAFVRIFEFSLGVCLVRVIEESPKAKERFNLGRIWSNAWIVVLVAFLAGIYGMQQIDKVDASPTYFNMYMGVAGMALLYVFILSRNKVLLAISRCKVVKYLSDYSLEIWCATFFTTTLAPYYQRMISGAHFNLFNIVISAVINLVLAIILKMYTKLVKNLVQRFSGFKVFLIVPVLIVVYFASRIIGANYMYDEYDFARGNVATLHMDGEYHDEGEYAWVTDNFSVTFNKGGVTQIAFRANTSEQLMGDVVNCDVYVDGTLVETVVVTEAINDYVVNVPEGVIKSGKFKVSLVSDKTFYPGEADPRYLAIRLFSISCK